MRIYPLALWLALLLMVPVAGAQVPLEPMEPPPPTESTPEVAPEQVAPEEPVESADPATDPPDDPSESLEQSPPAAPAQPDDELAEPTELIDPVESVESIEGAEAAGAADLPAARPRSDTDLIPDQPSIAQPDSAPDPSDGADASSETSTVLPRLNAIEIASFLDGLVEMARLRDQLPGVVVVVVEGDQLLLSHGWGYARVDERVAADPAASLFRVASVSKVVTATALMILQQRGQLRLDDPVSKHLDLPVFADAVPVTLAQLLSHQAGFEDGYLGHFFAADAASDHELEDYLTRYAPARVRPPGQLNSYCNYCTAVLGAVVAKVSGRPFEDAIEELVLGPAGMRRSTFREHPGVAREGSMPELLVPLRAQGYRHNGTEQVANGNLWTHRGMAPAGGLQSTAEDMARFMRLHLNAGSIDGIAVIAPDALAQMHNELTRQHPAAAANAHGFWSRRIGGLLTLEHGGALLNFYSNLVLLPERGIGIFVSTNGAKGRQLTQDLPRLLIERFVGARPVLPRPLADSAESLQRYVGIYRSTRRNHSTFEKASALLGGDTRVDVRPEGWLRLSGPLGSTRYVASDVATHTFLAEDDGSSIGFGVDADGQPDRIYPNYGHTVLQRVPWYARSELFMAIAAGVLLLSLLRVLGLRVRRAAPAHPLEHTAAWVAWLGAAAWIAYAAGLYRAMVALGKPENMALVRYPDQAIVWTLSIGLCAAVLSVLALLLWPAVMRQGHWPWWRRWHYGVFVLSTLPMIALLLYWKLLGFHFAGLATKWWPPGL